MKTLAKAGHEVHVVSPFPLKSPIQNYHDIHLDYPDYLKDIDMFETRDWSSFELINSLSGLGRMISNLTLINKNVQNLLKSDQKFDAVVVEIFWVEALYGFGTHFNAPLIGLSTFSTSIWTNDLTHVPMEYSYVPHNFVKLSDNMNFIGRTYNMLTSHYENLYRSFIHYRRQVSDKVHLLFIIFLLNFQEEIFNAVFSSSGKTFSDQMKNVPMVFLYHHFSVATMRPMSANMV